MMNVLFRLFSLLSSARNAREAIARARGGIEKLKGTAEGFQTASFHRTREKAMRGEVMGQYDMGEYYYDGRGVAKDYEEAFRWFRMAGEQGHTKSQMNVGLMLFVGRGVVRDGVEAYRWLKRAAEGGEAGAGKAMEKARGRLTVEEIGLAEKRG